MRWRCEICGQTSWADHSWCDVLLAKMERNKIELEKERERLLEDNPWLGFFKYNFDKWANSHPDYALDK